MPVELSVCDIFIGLRQFLFGFGATMFNAIGAGPGLFRRPRLLFARTLQINDLTHWHSCRRP
ncbi:hypothetical protein U91I_04064 [alpha proteobacterium U9-1i]|nr:hypothetical protein U91I_04064 [alpha proteobacterium U9-1i]